LISWKESEAYHAEAFFFKRAFLLNFKASAQGRRRYAADLSQKKMRSATRNQPKRHAGNVRWEARVVGRFRLRLRLRLLFFRTFPVQTQIF
jgi:hypothetical protein